MSINDEILLLFRCVCCFGTLRNIGSVPHAFLHFYLSRHVELEVLTSKFENFRNSLQFLLLILSSFFILSQR